MSENPIHILVADDIAANRSLLRRILEPAGYDVLLVPSGEEALSIASHVRPDLILMDVMMPGLGGFETCRRLKQDSATRDIPVIFVTAKDDNQSIVQGFQVGGVDYIARPFNEQEALARIGNHLRIHQLTRQLQQKNLELENEISKRHRAEGELARVDEQLSLLSQQEAEHWGIEGFLGRSPTIAAILNDVRQLQQVDKTSVLIFGESGTGKELIARAIHFGGARAKRPFVVLNCSAIPGDLAESTLFGHMLGAFTGARDTRKGAFEMAHGGTLFLDEIGDMPLSLQPKLLRVLENGTFTPVGAAREQHADVRVLSATNHDLPRCVAQKTFRQDLYFRIAQVTVVVPPLRARAEDIPLLAGHFLDMFAAEMGRKRPRLSDEAMAELQAYRFPGNVRELKNVMEHAMIKSEEGVILPGHLHLLDNVSSLTACCEPAVSNTQAVKNGDFERRKDLVVKRALQSRAQDSTSLETTSSRVQTKEEKILTYVEEHGSINKAECQALLSSDSHHTSYLLKKLSEYGLLVREGERRWARYRLPADR